MPLNKNVLKLHVTVFIWGFTAILGALISKSALLLVWYRMAIACLCLAGYILVRRIGLKVTQKEALTYFFIGILVALHWLLFYESIKVSKISITLISLSSITLFTSILDPIMNRRRISFLEIATGLAIMAGICLIFRYESRYTLGTLLGLGAAFIASIFTVLNSWIAKKSEVVTGSFYEMVGGYLFLSAYLALTLRFTPSNLALSIHDLIYLVVLGSICTALAYVMAFDVMKTLKPFTVNLITSLEPVYGIVLAFLFFGASESLTPGFYAGAGIILSAIFLHPFIEKAMGSNESISPSSKP